MVTTGGVLRKPALTLTGQHLDGIEERGMTGGPKCDVPFAPRRERLI